MAIGKKALIIAGVLAVVIVAAVLALQNYPAQTPQSGAAQGKFRIVVNPGVAEKVSVKEAQELEKYLEDLMGMDVELSYPASSAALIEALRFGHADAALGPGALVGALAVSLANAELVAVEYREVIIDGKRETAPYYYSYFIVLKESPYVYIDELRGKRVCFPSETSVSGFIMPLKALADRGYITPGEVKRPRDLALQFFGDVVFGGGYAQCWAALKEGKVDVTVMAGDVAASLYWEAMNNSRVLKWKDGGYAIAGPNPSHVVLVRGDLPEDVKTKFVNAIFALNNKPELMRKYVSAIFVRFEQRDVNEHLKPLIDALDYLKIKEFYLR
ncbi:phosphate/phosphite/phosphonate ABC transporter substrate-binding protein [Pyrobaculum aerophilum]|uniref:phosphate/phosphite/phosphonate ABC transporter substrate-binding protein n=1 Tax=Pyrobaculum aerophilum TaxID=13773 RepID=UPI002FD90C98